jgi:asparagine synthase (glutamine-hydrolysing)
MNAKLRHRGPDGDGFLHRPGVGLAMRRLAIIDVAGGDQPMTNEDQTIWLVFNGEIFNYPELRERLRAGGHQLATQSDTECIVHLYEDLGDECVTQLRGQFAFALWDQTRRRLLLARDRMGQKPIYYTVQDGQLYWASELAAMLAVLPERPPLNLQAIDDYLSLQYIPGEHTPFEGIYKLLPAHRLAWQDGELNVEPYWELEFTPKNDAPLPELKDQLRELLTEAVKIRLLSEVPLGAHLSGGIDSSIVVALMAGLMGEPVKTFSVGFEEMGFSELPHARAVAQRYATDHHEFTLTFGDIPATLAAITRHVGEPFADPSALPMYHLSRMTREHVTVALNGDGGDEAFAGYPRYWLDPLANAYLTLPDFITRGLVPGVMRILPDRADQPIGGSIINGLKRLGQLADVDPRASLLRWGSYFSPASKAALWRAEKQEQLLLDRAENYLTAAFSDALAETYLDRTLYTDIHTYLPGDLLVKADRMTMSASVEGRSPFLDHELMSWAARLPERYKVRGRTGKWILRETFADLLPPQIQGRGKQGFGIPVGAWFRRPLAEWAQARLLENPLLAEWFERDALEMLLDEHKAGRADHGKRIYALVMLSEWADQFAQA